MAMIFGGEKRSVRTSPRSINAARGIAAVIEMAPRTTLEPVSCKNPSVETRIPLDRQFRVRENASNGGLEWHA